MSISHPKYKNVLYAIDFWVDSEWVYESAETEKIKLGAYPFVYKHWQQALEIKDLLEKEEEFMTNHDFFQVRVSLIGCCNEEEFNRGLCVENCGNETKRIIEVILEEDRKYDQFRTESKNSKKKSKVERDN